MLIGLGSDPRAPGSLSLLTAFMSGLSPLTTHTKKKSRCVMTQGQPYSLLHTGYATWLSGCLKKSSFASPKEYWVLLGLAW